MLLITTLCQFLNVQSRNFYVYSTLLTVIFTSKKAKTIQNI